LKIYIAGPIQGYELKQGYRLRLQKFLSKLGHTIHDPWETEGMKNLFANVDFETAQDLVRRRLREVDACDALLAYFPKDSVGTAIEAMHAKRRGKLVILICPMKKPSPWIIAISRHFYKSIDEFERDAKALLQR